MVRFLRWWGMWAALGFALLAGGKPVVSLGEPPWGPGMLSFRNYGVDQGLTNLSVPTLAQDAQGYLWAGTEDGLFRYNGRAFQKFGAAEGLPSASIKRILCASDGWVWVETERGLVCGRDGQFRRVPLAGKDGSEGFNRAMAADGLGHVWIGTDLGLWRTEGGKDPVRVDALPPGPVHAVWADPSGQTLLVLRQGQLLQQDRGGAWQARTLPEPYGKNMPQAVLMDAKGRIWARSPGWLLRFDHLHATPMDLTSLLPSTSIQWGDLVQDGRGRIWAPTGRGVACFEREGCWILNEGRGLPQSGITALLVDREGSLWLAAEGLFRQLGGFAWSHFQHRQGLPHDGVWCVNRTRDGRLWVGTYQGLAYLQEGLWRRVANVEPRTYYTLAEDAEGTLWAGGLRSSRLATNSLQRIPKGSSAAQEVIVKGIVATIDSLAVAPDGTLWIGTVKGGLHRGRWEGGQLTTTQVSLPRQSMDEEFHQVLVDADGHPIVTGTYGLRWFDGTQWHLLTKREGLLDDQPGPMALGPDGALWVGYWEAHGVTKLVRRGHGWEVANHLLGPEPLTTDAVYSVAVDPSGVLWMGGSIGVWRWDGKRVMHFTRQEGLPGDDTSGNAILAEPNGDIWVGMSMGLAHLSASEFRLPEAEPATWITDFKDGHGKALTLGQRPILPYRDRAVTFGFSPATFLQEGRAKTQVRLVGFEDEWRDTDVFQARYTGLPAGIYRFEVRTRSPHGDLGPAVSQTFRVLAPWWKTWWAYLLYAGTASAAIYLAFQWRTRIILRHMVELESLVHERTWNLEDANRALSVANQALEEASMVDPLTGLKNRRFLGLSLPEELARVQRAHHQKGIDASQQDLAFLLVDLDHFKAVNDTFGHAAGDAVLRQSAAILRAACRDADSVVRWGGEEFLIVAKSTDRTQVEAIARKIRDGMRAHLFDLGTGQTLTKTCSIGFSAFPVLPHDPQAFGWEDAVELADQSLYAAKKSGRDAWVGVWVDATRTEPALGDRLLREVPELVREGTLHCVTSFPEGHRLVWKD